MSAETPWSTGRLGHSRGPGRLLFGNMYEDPEIEHIAFQGRGRVFCIASAGSTAMALGKTHEVIACDINPVQLAYAKRRVNGGGVERGDAERAMDFVRRLMPLIGWRENVVCAFLSLSDVKEQVEFWHAHLNTRRFRAGFDLLMSPAMLRFVYAPPFLACLPTRFGCVLRGRMERTFTRHANTENPFVKRLFLGEGTAASTPLEPCDVRFELGDAASYLESCAPGFFDGFTLSNILDGTGPAYRDRLFCAVRHAASKSAVVVLRSFGEPPSELTGNLANEDRAMFWGVVEVRRADSL